jgi:hypothetical protein
MVQGTGLANAAPQCQPDNESPQLVEAEAGDGTWQELMELAARARARAPAPTELLNRPQYQSIG